MNDKPKINGTIVPGLNRMLEEEIKRNKIKYSDLCTYEIWISPCKTIHIYNYELKKVTVINRGEEFYENFFSEDILESKNKRMKDLNIGEKNMSKFLIDITGYSENDSVLNDIRDFLAFNNIKQEVKVFTESDILILTSMSSEFGSETLIKNLIMISTDGFEKMHDSIPVDCTLVFNDSIYIIDSDVNDSEKVLINAFFEYLKNKLNK